MEYQKKCINESGDYVIIQLYDNGTMRVVPETRPAYLEWLAEGNTPTEIDYLPVPLPDLDFYRDFKSKEVAAESARRASEIDVERVAGFSEKFTNDIRITLLAKFVKIIGTYVYQTMTQDDKDEINRLLGYWNKVQSLQGKELAARIAIASASDHAAVDAIIDAIDWES